MYADRKRCSPFGGRPVTRLANHIAIAAKKAARGHKSSHTKGGKASKSGKKTVGRERLRSSSSESRTGCSGPAAGGSAGSTSGERAGMMQTHAPTLGSEHQ